MKLYFKRGMKYDFDGRFGAQCVDLFRVYCEKLGLPQVDPVVSAIDIFTKEYQPNFTKHDVISDVRNGDVVFKTATASNPYGHVAIVVDVGDDYMIVMEQDGFTQAGLRLAVWSFHDTARWAGLLRPMINHDVEFEFTD